MTPTDLTTDWPALWADALEIARCRRRGLAAPAGLRRVADAAPLALYAPLLARIAADAPWVVAQLGQSLDGCIATASGHSHFVTGAESLLHVHRLRALCDAVIVGAGTVAADDPQLTTRRVEGPNPVRVLLDPALRLSADARALSDGQAPTLWVHDASIPSSREAMPSGTECLAVAGLATADGGVDGRALIGALAARGLKLLFVEGGGVTVSRLLRQGCLDRLHLVIAPVIVGDGRRSLQLPSFARMDDCLRPRTRIVSMGEDVLWDLDLRGRVADA